MKHLLFISLLCVPLLCFSQLNLEKEIDSIHTEEAAAKFLESYKKTRGKLIVFNKEKHNTTLADDLFKLSKGGKKVFKTDTDRTYYKVIERQNIPYYRVSYIYLDGTKKSMDDINKERQKIIAKYHEGYRFEDLAKHFSMDQNAKRGGDLGWFTDGETHPDFESKVLNEAYSVNDIFTLDIPSKHWHYVILKTHDTKMIEEIKVLKVTEPVK